MCVFTHSDRFVFELPVHLLCDYVCKNCLHVYVSVIEQTHTPLPPLAIPPGRAVRGMALCLGRRHTSSLAHPLVVGLREGIAPTGAPPITVVVHSLNLRMPAGRFSHLFKRSLKCASKGLHMSPRFPPFIHHNVTGKSLFILQLWHHRKHMGTVRD